MYITVANGVPKKTTINDLRKQNPDVSFPRNPSRELLEEHGVYLVETDDRPEYDRDRESVRLSDPKLIDGVWRRVWTVESVNIEDRRSKMLQMVRDLYSDAMRPISAAYPPEEREGWPEQIAAAQEVLAGGQNALIDALRAGTGETAEAMAQTIIAKREQFLTLYGQVTNARRVADSAVASATSHDELDQIDLGAIFGS
jgi:hypothetical protein